MKQSPSNRLLVVQMELEGQSALLRRLAFLGPVRPLHGSGLLLLSLSGASEDPKTAWRRAQDILGTEGTVQPVLLDEDGESHYPTGEISVRFQQAPGDEELLRFASRHRVRPVRRNEFVPRQIVFEPIDPASYLPDILEQIENEGSAKAVWANTLSRFQKAQSF